MLKIIVKRILGTSYVQAIFKRRIWQFYAVVLNGRNYQPFDFLCVVGDELKEKTLRVSKIEHSKALPLKDKHVQKMTLPW